MQLTLRDNQGNERVVELQGVPSKGDQVLLDEGPEEHDVRVKEIIWAESGTTVATVDGFVAR